MSVSKKKTDDVLSADDNRYQLCPMFNLLSGSNCNDKIQRFTAGTVHAISSNDISQVGDGLLYFHVPGLKITDLYDWSSKNTNQGTLVLPSHGLQKKAEVSGSAVLVNEESIALFRYGSQVYAVLDKCPHAGGPLHMGDIEALPHRNSLCIICPWHHWKFDLTSGEILWPANRKDKRAVTFKTRVSNHGDIMVGFDTFNTKYFKLSEQFL